MEPRKSLPSWKRELINAISTPQQIADVFPWANIEELQKVTSIYPARITPYYAGLINASDPRDPIAAMCIPSALELDSRGLGDDPFGENDHCPTTGLVRRYKDRVLLMLTHNCPVLCRHCTRKRPSPSSPAMLDIQRAEDYLSQHPEIREIIISGGDPLFLDDCLLLPVLAQLANLPSIQWLRLASRVPVTLPMRITGTLLKGIKALPRPVFLNTHFNHPRELTPLATKALKRLRMAGITVSNQTVLLKGINDNTALLEKLFCGLMANGVRPYYIFLTDPVAGSGHFFVEPLLAIQMVNELSTRMGGMAVPRLALDIAQAPSKLVLAPSCQILPQTSSMNLSFLGRQYQHALPQCTAYQARPIGNEYPGDEPDK